MIKQQFLAVGTRVQSESFDDFQLDSFQMVLAKDIHKIIIKCSSVDIARTTFMRNIFPALHKSVSSLVNLSFNSGEFPFSLKNAVVALVIKDRRGDVNNLIKYRPASLLNGLSKGAERVPFNQLND